VSADGGGTQFVFPPGKTPDQLYQTLVVLISTLNRIKTADATDLTAVNQALTDAQQEISDLWEVVDAGGVGLTPQQAWELSLVTAVDTMLGSVSHAVLESIKQSQMAAEAVIRSLIAGKKNQVAIRVEQQARLTEREAFASQIETISAQLGNALAAIVTETTARTNADNALAAVDQTLTTALNGNIAQVNILAASIDGIEGRFGVAINTNGQVVGLIQLDGSAAGSNFTVVADKFQVAQPDAAGGTPVPVFTIANVGGTNKLVLRGDMIADGTITTAKLVASALSAITANLGTITAGILQSADGKFVINLNTKQIRIEN
jgi:predicted phage tail protein